jgi:hypothetical protein
MAPPFLTSALHRGMLRASRPGRLTLRERARRTHWTGGWISPNAYTDAVEYRKISCPTENRTPATEPEVRRYMH